MRFTLVDRLIDFSPGRSVRAVKAVSASEEYLADHFPTFPVLPGVFMLQAMVETATWLMRAERDFDPGPILLQEAKNVIYKNWVRPGHLLVLDVECTNLAEGKGLFIGQGRCEEVECVKGRFTLIHSSWASLGLPEARRGALSEALRGRFGLLTADAKHETPDF